MTTGCNQDIRITHPQWLHKVTAEYCISKHPDVRMQWVIELSRKNIRHGTGGPFAAAVFDLQTHQLIAAGVNVVVPNHCSMAHAEMIAIATAQQQLNNHDLGSCGINGMELVTSCEPCAMCFGAIPWSGIRQLVCGASAEDATAIGFDEGPRHPQWKQELEKRGIAVITEICRQRAADVLNEYGKNHGEIYNGRCGS